MQAFANIGDGQGRICVVSLNPAVDCEWTTTAIVPGEKNELASERRWPGGKGINVARWLRWGGRESRLVLPLGGATGREIAAALRAEKVSFRSVPIRQPTRVNVVVTPDTGLQLRFNPSWPVVSAAELTRLLAEARRVWRGCSAVVLTGSLVRGAPVDPYARMVRAAHGDGLPVALDCDGESFRRAALLKPDLVKPNEWELAQWAGRGLSDESEVLAAARALAKVTCGWVVVSRGASGVVAVDGGSGGELALPAVPVRCVRNTLGAGDALLAGLLSAPAGSSSRQWMGHALKSAAAAVRLAPGVLPRLR